MSAMVIVTTIPEMKQETRAQKSRSQRIGFVPTMGFLHDGHLSLVRASLKKADWTVVSIFVNPAQFAPQEDFKEYPRDLNRDTELLENLGVNAVFVPKEEDMYPPGFSTFVEVCDLQDKLCGRSRPGHFRGVCTIVLKLFGIVDPDIAFFGQKDAQQAVIIQRMVRDLHLDVEIDVRPIVREKDGLALSSRNLYLDQEERQAALCLFHSLQEAKRIITEGERDTGKIIQRIRNIILSEPLAKIDYTEIVDLENLDPLDKIETEVLVALAVYIGRVRLIDNMIIPYKE